MSDDPRPALSVVVPLYCEVHLATTVAELRAVLDGLELPWELILVDDGSPDGTWAVVQEVARHSPGVRALRLSRNFGKEAALAAGIDEARGEAVIVMDGDLQHPPSLIPSMIECWRSGAEIVEGVKSSRGPECWLRRLSVHLFSWVFSSLAGYDLNGASDFKLMDRRVVTQWQRMGERNLFFRGMTAWLGFRRQQLPFDVAARSRGRSGWSLLSLIRLAITAITSFSSLPMHLVTLSGLGFAAFSVVLGGQTLYHKLTGQAVDGFTTVILLLLMIGSAQMLGLGIIGTYIARIYEEVKGRPRFVVAERIE